MRKPKTVPIDQPITAILREVVAALPTGLNDLAFAVGIQPGPMRVRLNDGVYDSPARAFALLPTATAAVHAMAQASYTQAEECRREAEDAARRAVLLGGLAAKLERVEAEMVSDAQRVADKAPASVSALTPRERASVVLRVQMLAKEQRDAVRASRAAARKKPEPSSN